MELRHLRYFAATAAAGSLKLAAEEKLHTTQPSLSRQIRDLESELGVSLFLRVNASGRRPKPEANPSNVPMKGPPARDISSQCGKAETDPPK
jgi:hypothetical protein